MQAAVKFYQVTMATGGVSREKLPQISTPYFRQFEGFLCSPLTQRQTRPAVHCVTPTSRESPCGSGCPRVKRGDLLLRSFSRRGLQCFPRRVPLPETRAKMPEGRAAGSSWSTALRFGRRCPVAEGRESSTAARSRGARVGGPVDGLPQRRFRSTLTGVHGSNHPSFPRT